MNKIEIAGIEIHSHPENNQRFNVKNLWQANGAKKAKQSSDWLRLEGTKELIKHSSMDGILGAFESQVLILTTGDKSLHGTYMTKELCYAYAMWLSPKFYFLVVRTFDSLANATTTQEVIDLKFQLDNALQQDIFTKAQQPRDKNCLQVLMNCTPFQVNQFYDELEYQGQVKSRLVPQPPKRIFEATTESKYIIGKKGDTLLFDESVTELFPAQQDWTECQT